MSKVEELLKKVPESLARRLVPISIVLAEEIVNEIVESLPKPKAYKTVTFEKLEAKLDKVETLLSIEGEGKLREALLILDSPEARIHLYVDGFDRLPHHYTVSDLLELSPKLAYLSVFQENNNIVVHVKDLSFVRRVELCINPLTRVTLRKFFAILDVSSS